MQKSEQINELAAALAAAQAEIKGAVTDTENTFFKSKYADLESVWSCCKEPLTKNGLSVTQITKIVGTDVILETLLLHKSGQFLIGEYPIRPVKADPQSLGSATTYARRYTLAAIVGVYQVEDDDGNAASDRREPPPAQNYRARQQQSSPPPAAKQAPSAEEQAANDMDAKGKPPQKKPYQQLEGCISEKQRNRLFAIAGTARWPHDELKQYIEQVTGKKHSNEIPWVKYDGICKFVEANPYPPEPDDETTGEV